jgi:uncharacterized membrane protein (UPF0127 family)
MSIHKDTFTWALMAFALILVGVAAYFIITPQLLPHTSLHVGDGIYTAQVATSSSDQDAFISKSASLGQDQAGIFVYNKDSQWPIVASKVQTSVDLVWLNKDKKVVFIVKNASSANASSNTFIPRENARYIIVLPAGATTNNSISIDATATFDENNVQRWGM